MNYPTEYIIRTMKFVGDSIKSRVSLYSTPRTHANSKVDIVPTSEKESILGMCEGAYNAYCEMEENKTDD